MNICAYKVTKQTSFQVFQVVLLSKLYLQLHKSSTSLKHIYIYRLFGFLTCISHVDIIFLMQVLNNSLDTNKYYIKKLYKLMMLKLWYYINV